MNKNYFLIKIVDVGREAELEKQQTNNEHLVTEDFKQFLYQQYLKRGAKL